MAILISEPAEVVAIIGPPPTDDAPTEIQTGELTAWNHIAPDGYTLRPGTTTTEVFQILPGGGEVLISLSHEAQDATDGVEFTFPTAAGYRVESKGTYTDSSVWTLSRNVAAGLKFQVTTNVGQPIAVDATIYEPVNNQFNIQLVEVEGDITDCTVLLEGVDQTTKANLGSLWSVALRFVVEGTQRVDIEAIVDGLTQRTQFFLSSIPATDPGIYAPIIDGESLDHQSEFRYGFGQGVEVISESLVRVSDDPETVIRSGAHSNGQAYPARDYSTGNLGYGDYEIRIVYGDASSYVLPFSVPAPTPEPADSSMTILQSPVFTDGDLSIVSYVDHGKTITRRWLDIGGAADYDLPVEGGTKSYAIPLSTLGIAAGTHAIAMKASFSDTVPTESASATASIVVENIPVATLLDAGTANPADDTSWQGVIDNPGATDQQKAVAEDAIAFNAEIAAAQAAGDPIAPQMVADRNLWAAETGGSITVAQWLEEQQDWTDPTEIAEARAWVTEAPTSSIGALFNHMFQFVSWNSAEFYLQYGSVTYIQELQQLGYSDAIILHTYEAYQQNVAKGPGVMRFKDYVLGDRN